MRAAGRIAWGVLAAVALCGPIGAAQTLDRRQLERIEQTLRHEGEAVVELADAAAEGRSVPTDFTLLWHNDFFKAQPGTFIPFIVQIAPLASGTPSALLYVRASHREIPEDKRKPRRRGAGLEPTSYPFEEVYPIELAREGAGPSRIIRGFSLPAGDYDLTVVVREREQSDDRSRRRLAAVLRKPLSVPDFSTGELSASTVILADRLTVLPDSPSSGSLADRPYVVGGREIQPAADTAFRRNEELIVVFLVYNPAVTPDKLFDLEVEYHFFRRDGVGEAYFNRTEPQRFTPASVGPHFEPGSGQPVMAGQGVPLAGFQEGDYRLAIKVTDRISGRTVERQVTFSVGS